MKKYISLIPLAFLLAVLPLVSADSTSITVTFKVPQDISFSVAYAGSCSSSDFACVESDATIDGTQTQIPITQIDGTTCQDGSNAATTVTNSGNTNINITMAFDTALPTGVTYKVSQSSTGYESTCSENEPPTSGCVTISTSAKTVIANLAAGSSEDLWHWCDFSNFNSGAAGSVTRSLTLTSVAS